VATQSGLPLDSTHTGWHDPFFDPVMLPDPEHSFLARALLVAGYVAAAWYWSRAARTTRSDDDSYWWWVGTVGLILLTGNKLFNLRLVFEGTIRAIAKAGGWYEQRRPVQFVVAIVLPLLGVLIVSIMATKSRAFLKRHLTATIGWMLLLLYLVLRQTQEWKPSLVVLNAIRYHDWRLVLEVAGIVLVVVGASRATAAVSFASDDGARRPHGSGRFSKLP